MVIQKPNTRMLYKYLASIAAVIIVGFSTPQNVFADSATASEAPATSSSESTGDTTVTTPQQTTDVETTTTESPSSEPAVTQETTTPQVPATETNADSSISNNTIVQASSGDASVALNTAAGDATSGDANANVTVINLLQSSVSTNPATPSVTLYVQDIYGDVTGDITINPQLPPYNSQPSDLQINSSSSSSIDNTLEVDAVSGDAKVAYNTNAGDASSGDASVAINLINAVNSSISSGSTFIGVINIFGSLNGDILLSQDVMNALLTSASHSTAISGTTDSNISIDNDIQASAVSGDASVIGNTSAGDATSGIAQTSITIVNLTGRQIIGSNALLVFVNVLGNWVGMIVDAPSGSTSSVIAGGASNTESADSTVNSSENLGITNSIRATATSGDALVLFNTLAGSATSGDASVALNILNIVNSQLHMSDWLGVLFINVFGNWFGSFGVDTPAGGQSNTTVVTPASTQPNQAATSQVQHTYIASRSTGSYDSEESSPTATLADATVLSAAKSINAGLADPTSDNAPVSWLIPILALTLAAILFGTERYLASREAK